MMKNLFVLAALSAAGLLADELYLVTVDTSSLTGVTGALELQFNPGLNSQTASAQILSFSFDGTLGAVAPSIGNVSGTLPGTITFVNDPPLNDYFQELTFGSSLQFQVLFTGSGVNAPDGLSSGSTFAYFLFSDAGITPALSSDPLGRAGTIGFDEDGAFSVDNLASPDATIGAVSAIPEPSTLGMSIVGVLLTGAGIFRNRRRAG